MILHSRDHKVIYIDPTNANPVDGNSPSGALNTFPTEWEDNVVFIIRRTNPDKYVTLPNAVINSTSVVFMGMPKTGDKLYDSVPAEAQTAWGADTADWANVYANRTEHVDVLKLDSCMFFDMYGVRLYDKCTQDGDYALIRARNRNYGCSCNIVGNWVCTVEDWVTTGTKPANYREGGHWLSINRRDNYYRYGYKILFKDNRIDQYGRRAGSGIAFGYCENLEIKNIEINVTQCETNSSVMSTDASNSKAPIIDIENVHARYYYCDNDVYFPTIIGLSYSQYCTIKNCSYKKATTQHWAPSGNNVVFNSFISTTVLSAGSVISDIVIEYPDVRGMGSYGIDIVAGDYNSAQVGQYTKLEDITITCCEGEPICNEYLVSSDNHGAYNEDYYGDGESYHLIRCNLTGEGSVSYRDVSFEFLLKNIVITAPRGRAIFARYALLDMKANDIQGGCYFTTSMGKIGRIESWYPGYGFRDGGSNLIHISQMVFNRFNPKYEYTGQCAIIPSYNSNILVTDCNIEYMPNTINEDSIRACSYVCTNNNSHNGQGNYFVRNQKSFCRTWSVAREGSESGCSLKLYNESGSSDIDFPLMVGGLPFKGIAKTVTAGSHVARIYATTYGYNDASMIMDKLRVKLTFADKSSITSFDGKWTEDTTTVWNNIEAGKAYVLEIPFTVDEDQEIEFEYSFSWDMIGGATYLDPHPVIE